MTNNNLSKNSETYTSNAIEWKKIQSDMRSVLGNDIYESWLRKINFIEEFKNYVLLSVSTRFIRDWITSRYLDQILKIIKSYKKEINRIEFKIDEKKEENSNHELKDKDNIGNINENVSFIKDTYLQYNRIDPNKKFENFIVGESNKLALEASKKVSENISHYNPLYIYGGVGMGKTHLLNSVGLELKKIVFVEELSNYILLSVPTRFIRDWITSRYLDQILQSVKNHKKEIIRIEFTIIEQNNKDYHNKNILNSILIISFL